MRDLSAIMMFSFFTLTMLALTASTVWFTRKRGRPVKLLDVVPQWGGWLFCLPYLLELRPAAKIPMLVAAVGIGLFGAAGHFLRARRSSQEARVDGPSPGR